MKIKFIPILSLALFFCVGILYAKDNSYRGKRILFVNSYHPGYEWSDGEQRGAEKALKGTGVDLRIFYMDSKRNTSEEFCKAAGLKARQYIEEFKPDVVITSDDNAFVYLIMPYYRNADLPVVFCGINWDISSYGAPYKNTTGIIEVALIEQLYRHLKRFAKGDRLGFIGFDAPHERRNAGYYDQHLRGEPVKKVFVKDFTSWKKEFLKLQNDVDMIILGTNEGIRNWDQLEAERYIYAHIKVPTGTDMECMTPLCLIGLVKSADEHGDYGARIALRIIDGEKASGIPVITNKKGDLILNLNMAGKLGITFAPSLMKSATNIIDSEQGL